MTQRYVIGLDSSTQSTKAILWDRDGNPCAEGRAPHTLGQPQADWVEQDAAEWWQAASTALQRVTAQVDPGLIDGIAISHQRETMVLLDGAGTPLAPATLWLDSRAVGHTRVLDAELGAGRLHQITGKPLDVTPCVHRLRWMRDHQPGLLDRAAMIASVHDYLVRRLTGTAAASWTSADPFAIYDIHAKQWSRPILDHLGIALSKLPQTYRPGTALGSVDAQAAAATGLRAGTPVFAGGGDGHCAGLGVGAIGPGTVYLNLGTAVVGGLWSPVAEMSQDWRTLISATGEGYILEVVQRAGTAFLNWFMDTFGLDRNDPAVFRRLEAEAAEIAIGSDGVTVVPYLFGCMNPHWDGRATASFLGLGPRHTLVHMYRAALEAITLEFARSLATMRGKGLLAERIFTIGGGSASPLWCQMVADSTGLPVIQSRSNEASALGAGILAAMGAGWYDSFPKAVAGMTRIAESRAPALAQQAAWQALARRQAAAYVPTPAP